VKLKEIGLINYSYKPLCKYVTFFNKDLLRHNSDGPAVIIYPTGEQEWWVAGVFLEDNYSET